MARTDVEKWLVVDRPRRRRTDPALPTDALARLTSRSAAAAAAYGPQ